MLEFCHEVTDRVNGIDRVNPHDLAVVDVGFEAWCIGIVTAIEYCCGEHFGVMMCSGIIVPRDKCDLVVEHDGDVAVGDQWGCTEL